MYFWLFLYIGALLLTYAGIESTSKKHYKWFRVALVLFVSFAALLQSSNGTDIDNYRYRYNSSDGFDSIFFSISLEEGKNVIEIGYNLISILLNKLHIGFAGMLLLIYGFINGVFVHFVYKFRLPLLGIIALLVSLTFGQEINLQRQMVAIALFFLGIEQIEKKNIIKYLLCNLIAVLFHSSSVFLLPFGLLVLVNLQDRLSLIKILCSIFWGLSIMIALGIIGTGRLLEIMSSLLGDTNYSDYLTLSNEVGMGTQVSLLYQFLMFFVFLSNNRKNAIYLLLFSIACIFANLSVAVPNMSRFAFYFTAFHPLFLAELVGENLKTQFRIVSLAYCLYYFVYRIPIVVFSRASMLPDYSLLHNFLQ